MQPPVEINDPDVTVLDKMIDDGNGQDESDSALWWTVGAIWNYRRLITGLTALGAVLAVVISLLMPNEYESSARVLLPDASGVGMSALLGNLPPQAARLLGTGQSPQYTRYLAILTSESMMDSVIEEFDLVRVYEKENSVQPRADTRRQLRKQTEFEIDMEFDFLTVSVLDRDPERSARMANFFVSELNRRNSELSAQNASNYRRYVERRYNEVLASLDEAQQTLQLVQEEIGVVELPVAAEAFLHGVAEQRANLLQLEIQHGALLQQYGPENPRVIGAREALNIARRAESAALGGRDPLMPIGMADMPAAANRYATAYRNVLIQAELLQLSQPMYEQARFEEEREKVAVQIVDQALPPERKAKPRRSLIVIGATFSIFVLSIMLAFTLTWLSGNAFRLRRRFVTVSGSAG